MTFTGFPDIIYSQRNIGNGGKTKRLLSLILIISTCFSLLVSCDSTPRSAEDLWKKTKKVMNSLYSYREDRTIKLQSNIEGTHVAMTSTGYNISDNRKKSFYYYDYTENVISYNNSNATTSKKLTAYSDGKIYMSNESEGNKNALCSKASASEFEELLDACSSGWKLSPDFFDTLSFKRSDGNGWTLVFEDATKDFINKVYLDEGMMMLGLPKPKDITVTFQIDEKFRTTSTKIDFEFGNRSVVFSMIGRFSQYNSVNKNPIYNDDYTEVDDLRSVYLLSHKLSSAVSEKEGGFKLNIREEVQDKNTYEYDEYIEKNTVFFKNTEDGFEYDLTAIFGEEYYKIVFKNGKQTVTDTDNRSTTIDSTEYHAYVFIFGLINSMDFKEIEITDVNSLPFGEYEFICESTDSSKYVQLIEILEDTYVSHTIRTTVAVKDGEITEITGVIEMIGEKYIRTSKCTVKFIEPED
ncbi:MAG: hypothetical protein J6V09_07140 [Clostridia bacterium]|nr:hypothetical protein [Clostridia bacterium]